MEYKMNNLQWAETSKIKKKQEIVQNNDNCAMKISNMFAF